MWAVVYYNQTGCVRLLLDAGAEKETRDNVRASISCVYCRAIENVDNVGSGIMKLESLFLMFLIIS
jgi:hypothetical protein